MLCLSLVSAWSQWRAERLEQNIFDHEIAPLGALHRVERVLLSIQQRMQGASLGHAPAAVAGQLLAEQREKIREGWAAYQRDHAGGLRDSSEMALIEDFEQKLPELWRFLEQAETAYRGDGHAALAELLEVEWSPLQDALFVRLNALSEFQEHHVARARQELEQSRRRSLELTGALVAVGILMLSGFAYALSRSIMRRIADIETALEGVAAGRAEGIAPYPEDETETFRITRAINRTFAELTASHHAITGLMRTQHTILESVGEGIYGVDCAGRIMFINPAALAMLGYREGEVLGRSSHELLHHHRSDGRPYPLDECPIAASRRTGRVTTCVDEVFFHKDGHEFPVEYTSAPLRDVDDSPSGGGVVVFHDVTRRREQEQLLQQTVARLRQTNAQLVETQNQLLQAEKLAGLGQLAAGVAHEINNPIAFIQANIGTLDNYVQALFELIAGYGALIENGADADSRAEASRLREHAELEFLRDDIRALITETRDGLWRVTHIVADLRDFSRAGGDEDWDEADLLHGLESTLGVVSATVAGKAEIIRDYEPLPAVRCHAAQINQVFMNLLLNAAHAIDGRGTIALRTRRHGDEVCIGIRDSGRGMDARECERMFDPFFTTKPVGEGTGLGLSVSYGIVQRHGGRFEVDSEPGVGTTVCVWLPVNGQRGGRAEAAA